MISEHLRFFLESKEKKEIDTELITHFLLLDDYDIWWALKEFARSKDESLSYLSDALLLRHIFEIQLSKEIIDPAKIEEIKTKVQDNFSFSRETASNLVFTGSESNEMYNIQKDEIMVLKKNGDVLPFSAVSDYPIGNTIVENIFYVILNFHTLQGFKII